MKCNNCGYIETITNKFIGIFANGTSLNTTDGVECGLYMCPNCNNINMTTDTTYIQMRKKEYIEKMKNK